MDDGCDLTTPVRVHWRPVYDLLTRGLGRYGCVAAGRDERVLVDELAQLVVVPQVAPARGSC